MEPSAAIRSRFLIGDGVEDVLASDETIVATYFDEGVFSFDPISPEGIAVFDVSGSFRFGYFSEFEDRGRVTIDDCYAAVWHEKDVVAFYAYSDFNVVFLDVSRRTQTVLPPPRAEAGFHSVSTTADAVYLHSPYQDQAGQVFRYDIAAGDTRKLADEIPARVVGLPGGRFLTARENGYTIWTITD